MDIRPPVKRPVPPPIPPVPPTELPKPVDEPAQQAPLPKPRRTRRWIALTCALIGLVVVMLVGWYSWALMPRDPSDDRQIRFVVQEGTGTGSIAQNLESHGLIRSAFAFRVYVEVTGNKAKLQAGGFALSPSESVRDIVAHIVKGNTDELNVLVLPGLTLKQQLDPEIPNSFAWQGFTQEEIEAAFAETYHHPLFAGRPQGATLEGYIFPETYRIHASDSLSVLLEKSFDEIYDRLISDGLIAKFKAKGLNLYEAFTLASIVQKEVRDPDDQRQVAQVFLKRLKEGMVLGSDVTFFYAADQMGVKPSVNLDSPYNTRKYGGLPPGPIANMNYSALQAVADPAPGEYLYFVAGDGDDEGKTFYARTEAEHEENIAAHCHVLCR